MCAYNKKARARARSRDVVVLYNFTARVPSWKLSRSASVTNFDLFFLLYIFIAVSVINRRARGGHYEFRAGDAWFLFDTTHVHTTLRTVSLYAVPYNIPSSFRFSTERVIYIFSLPFLMTHNAWFFHSLSSSLLHDRRPLVFRHSLPRV